MIIDTIENRKFIRLMNLEYFPMFEFEDSIINKFKDRFEEDFQKIGTILYVRLSSKNKNKSSAMFTWLQKNLKQK